MATAKPPWRGGDHARLDAGPGFDSDAAWNERRQIYEHSNLIIDSTSVTAVAERGREDHWTCTVAAAVFLFS
jgi:arginine decarboxylase